MATLSVGSVLHLALPDVQLVIGTIFYRSGRALSIIPGAVLPNTLDEFEQYRRCTAETILQYDHAIEWICQNIRNRDAVFHPAGQSPGFLDRDIPAYPVPAIQGFHRDSYTDLTGERVTPEVNLMEPPLPPQGEGAPQGDIDVDVVEVPIEVPIDPSADGLTPAAESSGPSEQQPTGVAGRRRKPSKQLTIITNLAKRVKAAISSNGSGSRNGNGNGAGNGTGQVRPVDAPSRSGQTTQQSRRATPLLDAPLSARIMDTGSALLNAVNPFKPTPAPVALPADSDKALEDIVGHIAADFADNQIPVNRVGLYDVTHPTTSLPRHERGIRSFYLRTKALSASNVILLRDHFLRRFRHPEFLTKLDGQIGVSTDGSGTLHPRYVGTVAGPGDPNTRYEEDLKGSSLFAKVDLIIQEMKENFELVDESPWTLQELAAFHSPDLGSTDSRTLFVERMIIPMFGHHLLVNVQHGGTFEFYESSAEENVGLRCSNLAKRS
ncbi:hypothetical protein HKX48_007821 [Thoreauomyces humboldtii]|nr:hypothetical protein HKX48_007821 [Thoreauomyces humboldtii]